MEETSTEDLDGADEVSRGENTKFDVKSPLEMGSR